MGSVNGPVISMLHTMSKCLNMGMALQDVIRRSTWAPACEIGRRELGHLGAGADADVAVLKRVEGVFGYADCGGAKIMGTEKLACAMTLRAGRIVFDLNGLTMPLWEDAPEPYWVNPTLQT